MNRLLSVAVLLMLASAHAVAAETARATFAVHCYDVGARALENRPGVLEVERGWQGFREVDRVRFDPQQVSREQLERWLREAGTYVKTLDAPQERP